jgi:uncharacterized membrane protein YjjP (DUF1212 family)
VSKPESDVITSGHGPTVRFMLRLVEALHRYGAPANRLEDLTKLVARRLGVEGQFAALPSAFFASFGHLESQRTYLVRVESAELNLDKQVKLDEVVTSVLDGEMAPDEGERRIDAILAAPPLYGRLLTSICYGISSGVAARFFGGGWREIVVSSFIGILVGILSNLFSRNYHAVKMFEVAATVMASILAVVGIWVVGPLSTTIALLGGVVYLLPGYTVTVALTELASRHFVSGTGRMMGAITVLLVMGLGVALGDNLSVLIFGPGHDWITMPLPKWTEAVALVLGMCAYVVLLRVPLGEALLVILAGALTYATAQVGNMFLSSGTAVGMAALVLGLYGNLYTRIRKHPASIPVVPAVMYLVPGSIGLKSLFSLMEKNTISGIDGAYQMTMIAVSIVTGLLLANVLIPPRKIL